MGRVEILRSASVDVVIDTSLGVPAIVYWGSSLGSALGEVALEAGLDQVVVPGLLDVSRRIPVVPMHADGFPGRPGLQSHRRGGRHWSPRFTAVGCERFEDSERTTLVCTSVDSIVEVRLDTHFVLDVDGVLTTSAVVHNVGESPFMVDALSVSVPFPETVGELAVFSGRWAREFQMDKFAWTHGAWTAENRSGRTSHEHPPFIWLFEDSASNDHGNVWALHTAWSGNHVVYAERLSDERRYVQLGELFHPGEICLDPGETLSTPDIIGAHSNRGLNGTSRLLRKHVRRIIPKRDKQRPVHLNTWEAVYFDHDSEKLQALADVAASVGVERFVLDDGWFAGRRDDSRGLGDWFVSTDVYPNGLHPLIDHVKGLGLEFGIWVEPEMANPDSDLVRAHPDWILATAGYEPVLGRNQVALDLSRGDVSDHLFDRLHSLLSDHDISYVKWDMNRPLVQGSNAEGKASSHRQTMEVYRLLDRLRTVHADVEFESCASGGGRIDYEMLRRVDRVWASDSNDALERQLILRGAALVLPLEILGSHIGPSPSHTTRRRHSMSFRAATALFGHFGIEADLTQCDERDLADITRAVDVYKRFRHLVHTGDYVRIDVGTSSPYVEPRPVLVHAVLSIDRVEALLCIAQLETEASLVAGNVRIPGLISDAEYRVDFVPMSARQSSNQSSGLRLGPAMRQPSWLHASVDGKPVKISGRVLETVGFGRPTMWPESAIVVHLSCA